MFYLFFGQFYKAQVFWMVNFKKLKYFGVREESNGRVFLRAFYDSVGQLIMLSLNVFQLMIS